MLTTLLKWLAGSALLGSLFWCSARDCAALLLAVWVVAIGVFVCTNLPDRFLWVPVSLALAGLFSAILVLTIPANVSRTASVATLVLFVVSLEVLKKRRSSLALMRHRAG